MTVMVLYDDAAARALEPFALTRPAGELRAGGALIRERWELAMAASASAFVGAAHLASFAEFDAPAAASTTLAAGTVLVNTRCAPALEVASVADVWTCEGRVAAVRLREPLALSRLAEGACTLESLAHGTSVALRGWWIDNIWDLTRHLDAMLLEDIPVLAQGADAPPAHVAVLGAHDAWVARGAYVEPYVLFDTTRGPVLVQADARVSAFTRLVGPCIVGRSVLVSGGRIAGCAIGDHARVHGELSATIVIGHANKAHDGFVGHSVIGRWANLGAGTITSNLKNSYGEISLWTHAGERATGLQHLGAFIGDHAKLGIGSRLTTGCVIGAGANVFGARVTPKYVPPFAWGEREPFGRWDLPRFLAVAERVMARRELPLREAERTLLEAAWRRGQSPA